jgi:prolyl-tRNA synthetase
MYWTKTFIPTIKEVPQEAESASHQLMLCSGLVRMLMAGAYTYLPLGLRVLENIQRIIREEMAAAGASELLLPALQPLEIWQKTGRDKTLGEVMYRFTDRRKRAVCLGPTHEEIITSLVKDHVSSYRQLPMVLYQIQTKFRDEIRPRFGVVRACEFIMKDAYSFDRDEAGLQKNYQLMHTAYQNIFSRCGLDFISIEADSGVMGGSVSHEFMVPAESGEDFVFRCPACRSARPYAEGNAPACACGTPMAKINTEEVGHIFQLGTKYTVALEAMFLDQEGQRKPIIMGCYGIGVSRLVATIIEQHHDAKGILWPKEVSPAQVLILPLDVADPKIMEQAEALYRQLRAQHVEVLLDDRDERPGVKFNDADLLGFPWQLVIGKEYLKSGNIEVKRRSDNSKSAVRAEDVPAAVRG